jgi:hypothetical protein
MGGMRNTHTLLVVKSEGKRPLWIPKSSWKYNIKINLINRASGRELGSPGSG